MVSILTHPLLEIGRLNCAASCDIENRGANPTSATDRLSWGCGVFARRLHASQNQRRIRDLPEGFRYQEAFITAGEEALLAAAIADVEFAAFEMRGVVARRRVAFFGRSYDNNGAATPPIPAFLIPYRDRLAAWAGLDGDAFAMALINEYREGAPIGWHRDAPQYDIVAGISLLSPCRMKLRPHVAPKELHGPPGPQR